MKFLSLKNLAMTGALSIAGLGLVGIGAHAVFTTSSVSAQTITAGTPSVLVWSTDASNGCTSLAIALGNPQTCNNTVPLNPVGPVGSTFETPASTVYFYNNGNIPVTEKSIKIGVTPSNNANDQALYNQVNVCIHNWDNLGGTPAAGWVEATGPLWVANTLNPSVNENAVTLAPGQQFWYSMDFYAGQNSSCTPNGFGYSDGPHTNTAWAALVGGPYATPPSLTNAAEGGSLATTFTFNYTA